MEFKEVHKIVIQKILAFNKKEGRNSTFLIVDPWTHGTIMTAHDENLRYLVSGPPDDVPHFMGMRMAKAPVRKTEDFFIEVA